MSRRFLLLAALLATVFVNAASAQGTPSATACEPLFREPLTCALHVAGIAELRDVALRGRDWELRYWVVSGMFEPDRFVQIQSHGDSLTGRLLLIWSGSMVNDSFAIQRCLQGWWSVDDGLCVARQPKTPDWAALVRGLERLHYTDLVVHPALGQRCQLRNAAGSVIGSIDCVMHDGFTSTLEVRTAHSYWTYEFPRVPDNKDPGFRRDSAIVRLMGCAMGSVGDGVDANDAAATRVKQCK